MTRGEISIADVLRALAGLRPGSEALEVLWELLQFELARDPALPVVLPEPASEAAPPEKSSMAPARVMMGLSSELRPLSPRDEAPLPWADVEPLPAQPPVLERPPLEPLLPSLVRRAILSTAISTREEVGEVDVAETVEAIATGRVMVRLPRLAVPSLRRGVQVLADVGEGMLPYASDRSELLSAVERSVGREQTEVVMFAGTPLRKAGRGPRHRWGRWAPPPRGTPVLLLTDLGIGGPLLSRDRATLGEWLRFREEVRRAGCPLLAFVPYEPRRWPVELVRGMTVLPWDRGVTVSVVRHAVRPGVKERP